MGTFPTVSEVPGPRPITTGGRARRLAPPLFWRDRFFLPGSIKNFPLRNYVTFKILTLPGGVGGSRKGFSASLADNLFSMVLPPDFGCLFSRWSKGIFFIHPKSPEPGGKKREIASS